MKPLAFVGDPIDTDPQYADNAIELQKEQVRISANDYLAELLILRDRIEAEQKSGVLFSDSFTESLTLVLGIPLDELGTVLQELADDLELKMSCRVTTFRHESRPSRRHTRPYVAFERLSEQW